MFAVLNRPALQHIVSLCLPRDYHALVCLAAVPLGRVVRRLIWCVLLFAHLSAPLHPPSRHRRVRAGVFPGWCRRVVVVVMKFDR